MENSINEASVKYGTLYALQLALCKNTCAYEQRLERKRGQNAKTVIKFKFVNFLPSKFLLLEYHFPISNISEQENIAKIAQWKSEINCSVFRFK